MNDPTEKEWRLHIAMLLIMSAGVMCATELASRLVVPKISRIESIVESEQRAANSIGVSGSARPTLLIVGNSLLKTGVDMPALRQSLAPEWHVQRFMIEQTDYLDWYFGLQNLLENGNKPAAIALMLNARQVLANSVRGSYSAYRLFSAVGTVRAGLSAGYHPTEISGMLVGHFIAYYGLRAELRKFAFQRVVPGAVPLAALILREPVPSAINTAQFDAVGRDRLEAFGRLCKRYAVRCLFLVPPSQKNSPARLELVSLAGQAGLSGPELDVGFSAGPLRDGDAWGDQFFDVDHFHFSPAGAAAYTLRLGHALKRILVPERQPTKSGV